MAQLTQAEFQQAIALLANDMGLQRLRDRFVRLNALVTRRKVASPQALADQLYLLSAGLRRQVPATYAFHAIWGEQINSKLGEEGEKNIEKIAETVNTCLGDDESIVPEKAADLDAALADYARAMGAAVGEEMARMDMLLKSVPAIAAKLRAASVQPAAPPSEGTEP
ncbi:MAG: hypothetical protein H6Q33_1663 [Deltaproteobacteria bacterium]|nr:hypothetical protein [Deltaproteobacteria bacterium]